VARGVPESQAPPQPPAGRGNPWLEPASEIAKKWGARLLGLGAGPLTFVTALVSKAAPLGGKVVAGIELLDDEEERVASGRVYQRNDWIDPARVDSRSRTNLARMRAGRAPLDANGKSIELHHLIQTQRGPLAEVTSDFHRDYHRQLHINPSTTPSGIGRERFELLPRRASACGEVRSKRSLLAREAELNHRARRYRFSGAVGRRQEAEAADAFARRERETLTRRGLAHDLRLDGLPRDGHV
jgi:hypothetical protein